MLRIDGFFQNLGRNKEGFSPTGFRGSTVLMTAWFRLLASRLWGNTFLTFYATQFVLLCFSSPRKLIWVPSGRALRFCINELESPKTLYLVNIKKKKNPVIRLENLLRWTAIHFHFFSFFPHNWSFFLMLLERIFSFHEEVRLPTLSSLSLGHCWGVTLAYCPV